MPLSFSGLSPSLIGIIVASVIAFILLIFAIIYGAENAKCQKRLDAMIFEGAYSKKQGYKVEYASPIDRALLAGDRVPSYISNSMPDTLDGVASTGVGHSMKFHAQKQKAVKEGYSGDPVSRTAFDCMKNGEQPSLNNPAQVARTTEFAEMGTSDHLKWMSNYSGVPYGKYGPTEYKDNNVADELGTVF